MNKCLACGKDVQNKYCNVACQNRHLNKFRAERLVLKRRGLIVEKTSICEACKTEFKYQQREKDEPKRFCSRRCANSIGGKSLALSILKEAKCIDCGKHLYIKKRVSSKIARCDECKVNRRIAKRVKITCCDCKQEYLAHSKNVKRCRRCSTLLGARNGGRKSAQVQAERRRSKNEILFAELCKQHFKDVKCNVPIFNGWDADVIIEDIKVAVLWNGNWHHKKITKKHSVKQVQNRDNIKISEIIKCGYKPYVINDFGKKKESFVKEEFDKFCSLINCGVE